MMKEKQALIQRGVFNILTALIGLGLLLVFVFSLNTLLASRSQQPAQTVNQLQKPIAQQPLSTSTLITSQPQAPTSQQLSPTPTTASSQTDPTAGWRVFSNEAHGYSIKYPSDWFFASEGENAFLGKTIYISNYDTKTPYKSFEKNTLKIQLSVNPVQIENGQTIEEWFMKHPYYGQRPAKDDPGLYLLPIETSIKKINDIPALRVLAKEGAAGGLSSLNYFIPMPGTDFILVISAMPGNSVFLDTFELIVDSLQFNR